MSAKVESTRARNVSWEVFAAVVVVALALMVGAYFWIWSLVPAKDWSTFADVYGALVGTFFSGLAFAGLLLTVHLQRRELRETQEQLAKTATAQVESQKAHEAHVEVATLTARLNAATALRQFYNDELKYYDDELKAAVKEGTDSDYLESLIEDSEAAVKEILKLRDELKHFIRHGEITAEAPLAGTSATVTTKSP